MKSVEVFAKLMNQDTQKLNKLIAQQDLSAQAQQKISKLHATMANILRIKKNLARGAQLVSNAQSQTKIQWHVKQGLSLPED